MSKIKQFFKNIFDDLKGRYKPNAFEAKIVILVLIAFFMYIGSVMYYDVHLVPSVEAARGEESISNDASVEYTKIEMDDATFTQSITAKGNGVGAFDVVISHAEGEDLEGNLTVSLTDQEGNVLFSNTYAAADMVTEDKDEYVLECNLDEDMQQVGVSGKTYNIVLKAEGMYNSYLCVSKAEAYTGGELTIENLTNQKDSLYDMQFVIYGTSINFMLNVYKKIVPIVILIALIFIAYLEFFEVRHMRNVYAAVILFFGVLMAFVMTPLDAPDEAAHYATCCHHVAELFGDADEYVIELSQLDEAKNDYLFNYLTNSYKYADVKNVVKDDNQDYYYSFYNSHITYLSGRNVIAGYLPQIIGISVGRLFHVNYAMSIYLARLFNLIFYIAFIYLAMVIFEPMAPILFAISMLPLNLELDASASYDPWANALSFVFLALVLRCTFNKEKKTVTIKDLILMLLVLLLSASVKYVPIVLGLLILIIPLDKIFIKLKFMKQQLDIKHIKAIIYTSLAVVIFGIIIWANIGQIDTTTSVPSMKEIISSPVNTTATIMKDIIENGSFYFDTILGLKLASFNVKLSTMYVYPLLVFMTLSFINRQEWQIEVKRKQVFMLLITAFVFAITIWIAFLSQTSERATRTIYGIQGRYFTSMIPLLAVASWALPVKATKKLDKYIIVGFIIMEYGTILDVFSTIMNTV